MAEEAKTIEHTCHAYGCKTEVPRKMFMCSKHWFKVPKRLRDLIWRSYQPGQEEGEAEITAEYFRVTKEAIDYLKKKEGHA